MIELSFISNEKLARFLIIWLILSLTLSNPTFWYNVLKIINLQCMHAACVIGKQCTHQNRDIHFVLNVSIIWKHRIRLSCCQNYLDICKKNVLLFLFRSLVTDKKVKLKYQQLITNSFVEVSQWTAINLWLDNFLDKLLF